MEKMSDIEDKTTYELIKNDYNNNYGYDLGINNKITDYQDKNPLKKKLNVKKR